MAAWSVELVLDGEAVESGCELRVGENVVMASLQWKTHQHSVDASLGQLRLM